MIIKPLSKTIYDRAVALKVDEIHLNFSGGSDEGYLNVDLRGEGVTYGNAEINKLNSDIEKWAWSVYSYSGAGDGNDYGDDVTYDLVNKRVTVEEWYTARQYGESGNGTLEIVE